MACCPCRDIDVLEKDVNRMARAEAAALAHPPPGMELRRISYAEEARKKAQQRSLRVSKALDLRLRLMALQKANKYERVAGEGQYPARDKVTNLGVFGRPLRRREAQGFSDAARHEAHALERRNPKSSTRSRLDPSRYDELVGREALRHISKKLVSGRTGSYVKLGPDGRPVYGERAGSLGSYAPGEKAEYQPKPGDVVSEPGAGLVRHPRTGSMVEGKLAPHKQQPKSPATRGRAQTTPAYRGKPEPKPSVAGGAQAQAGYKETPSADEVQRAKKRRWHSGKERHSSTRFKALQDRLQKAGEGFFEPDEPKERKPRLTRPQKAQQRAEMAEAMRGRPQEKVAAAGREAASRAAQRDPKSKPPLERMRVSGPMPGVLQHLPKGLMERMDGMLQKRHSKGYREASIKERVTDPRKMLQYQREKNASDAAKKHAEELSAQFSKPTRRNERREVLGRQKEEVPGTHYPRQGYSRAGAHRTKMRSAKEEAGKRAMAQEAAERAAARVKSRSRGTDRPANVAVRLHEEMLQRKKRDPSHPAPEGRLQPREPAFFETEYKRNTLKALADTLSKATYRPGAGAKRAAAEAVKIGSAQTKLGTESPVGGLADPKKVARSKGSQRPPAEPQKKLRTRQAKLPKAPKEPKPARAPKAPKEPAGEAEPPGKPERSTSLGGTAHRLAVEAAYLGQPQTESGRGVQSVGGRLISTGGIATTLRRPGGGPMRRT